jgi:hypothetical protein
LYIYENAATVKGKFPAISLASAEDGKQSHDGNPIGQRFPMSPVDWVSNQPLCPVLPDTSIRCPSSKSLFSQGVAIKNRISQDTVKVRVYLGLGKTIFKAGS